MASLQSTVNEHIRLREDTFTAARTVSLMCAVIGLWYFVSPWAYAYSPHESAWNSWIVGAVMFLCAVLRLLSPARTTAFSYVNAALAVWVFISPWVYGFAGESGPRLVNSLAVGVLMFALSLISARETRRHRATARP
jgi:hypothetical protein